jgi:hypothetical protein
MVLGVKGCNAQLGTGRNESFVNDDIFSRVVNVAMPSLAREGMKVKHVPWLLS